MTDDHEDLVKAKADITWLKVIAIATLTSVWLQHFIDATLHWGVLQFP